MRAYLSFSLDKDEEYLEKYKGYQTSVEFLETRRKIYNIESVHWNDIEESLKESLLADFDSDPSWRNQGPLNFDLPSLALGRIIVELYRDTCPKTCDNFLSLCTGSKGFSKNFKGKALHYKSCLVHRIVKDYIIQSGDITRMDGSGGDSIYGGKFNDEKESFKKYKFESMGILAMANSGKNSNTSQFFFTTTNDAEKLSKLNGRYVIFGRIVEGMETLNQINGYGSKDGDPTRRIIIDDCGEV